MIRLDHLIHEDNASLRNDFFIDTDNGSGVDSVARDSGHSNSSDCFTHAMVNVRSRKFPRSVL